jgi:hypothetical protein
MSVINRFLLLLLSLTGTALALSVLGAFCQLLPEQLWLEQIRFALSRQETVVVAVICSAGQRETAYCSLWPQWRENDEQGRIHHQQRCTG